MTPAAPTPRPAQNFGTIRAQSWVLGAAIVVAMTYALRRFVEPAMGSAPTASHAARLAGHGGPPPALARWSIAYGTGFMFLALIALPAPELAASLALLTVTGTLLANGKGITTDLAHLEGVKEVGPIPTAADLRAQGEANIAAGRSPLAGVPGYGPGGLG